MRFSFKMEGRVSYGDILGTIALLLTIIGFIFLCRAAETPPFYIYDMAIKPA